MIAYAIQALPFDFNKMIDNTVLLFLLYKLGKRLSTFILPGNPGRPAGRFSLRQRTGLRIEWSGNGISRVRCEEVKTMRICWWSVAIWLLTGLLMFTVGVIVGALYAIGVLLFLWVFIALAVLWLALLILVKILFHVHCRACWEKTKS